MSDTNPSSRSWLPKFLQGGSTTDGVPTERTRLLKSDDGNEENEAGRDRTKIVLTEFWLLFKSSLPVIVAYSLQNSLQTLSVLVVGRSSPENLSIAAFSYMMAMSSGWLIALGGTTALDTLASSAFTGSENKHTLGILLQRGLFILGLLYVPVAILWIFSEPIFKALGQSPEISSGSAKFLTYLVPGGLGYIYFEAMKKYLQAQRIMRPGTYVLLITSPLNVALNYVFVYTLDLGLVGAPIATGISYWLSFFLLLCYARFVAGWECWGGWSKKAFKHTGTFLKLALSGIIQVGTEWIAFAIVHVVSGQLGQVSLGAQSVIATSDQVINTIPFGIGVATSARVGNLLGSRDAKGAARAANTAAVLSMIVGAVILAALMGVKNVYAKIFTDDEQVIQLTSEVMPYVAVFQVADGLVQSCGGSLRGMGRQHLGAAANIVSYYGFALPLGIYLAFHGWGLGGLWLGQCVALYSVGIMEWVIVAFSNWSHQVQRAFDRMDPQERAEIADGNAPEARISEVNGS